MDVLPSLPTFLAFTAATLLLALTPGPDMTLWISRALGQGRRNAMMAVIGTQGGLVVHTMLVAFGVSALIVASPTAFLILKTGGAAYLFFLAVQALRKGSSFALDGTAPPRGSGLDALFSGFWVNLLNPKVIIFFMTFLPQFVSASDPHVTGRLLFLGAWFIVASLPVCFLTVFAAHALSSWLANNRKVLRSIDYLFAGVFSVFALKILTAQAR
ncbi:LysE family translocator [Ensifer soli]|uniref:LysE family translocator n=1 Tax=Ciceribacter sp. sgz301302 TaxID=3342379 RepID=UPI0035BB2181